MTKAHDDLIRQDFNDPSIKSIRIKEDAVGKVVSAECHCTEQKLRELFEPDYEIEDYLRTADEPPIARLRPK